MASALSALAGAMRGKFSNRQGHSKGAFPLTSKRGPRDFYKGKGAKSTGRLTKKGACAWGVAGARAGGRAARWRRRVPQSGLARPAVRRAVVPIVGAGPTCAAAPGVGRAPRSRPRSEPQALSCAARGCAHRLGRRRAAWLARAPRAPLWLPSSVHRQRARSRSSVPLAAGIFIVQPHKLEEFVVPDLEGCEVCPLLPSRHTSVVLHCRGTPCGRVGCGGSALLTRSLADAVETVRGLQYTETTAPRRRGVCTAMSVHARGAWSSCRSGAGLPRRTRTDAHSSEPMNDGSANGAACP
jgi:hypothetical protein